MKIIFTCLFGFVAFAVADHYTDRYDNIDLDEILSNKRLLLPYIKCILEESKCSPDGKELKSHLTEAIQEDCGKCTDQQKKGSMRVIAHLINKEAEYWNKIKAKYDPENKYSPKYEKELREKTN